uniref:Uncharacterized protein n=1 Tax=Pseudomonas putida (strain ATCC 700007 / DSM 6899 / JCM 31910 / BCRC 17059 / LMG 24140 / F1) TaxID=351746 RepID=A5WAI8_PSEP1
MVGPRVQDSTPATRLIPSPVKVTSSKKPPLKGGFFVPEFWWFLIIKTLKSAASIFKGRGPFGKVAGKSNERADEFAPCICRQSDARVIPGGLTSVGGAVAMPYQPDVLHGLSFPGSRCLGCAMLAWHRVG